ncbi:putative valine--tRNA ligase, cytoplasmic [Astathelohania contejeani]|uniref:valine--tRNA ligase n=1 Tax=Astathelohania contejeani TaxID=164912 RepID=A0ABQ7I1C4_9MICR|nr:putative valine--tRNA ligase, cytoplasmic [Thelohania contejeani]
MDDRKLKKEEKKRMKLEKLKQKQEKMQTVQKPRKKIVESVFEYPQTPHGDLKDLSILPSSYDPGYTESAWQAWWEKTGVFMPHQGKEPFVVAMPPPNVTGSLHIGHAMMIAIQDALVRYKRLHGHEVLFVPGCDHAGIATQSVVEKRLLRNEGKTREQIGRDKFVSKVWEWKNQHGDRIYEQLRELGTSADFTRQKFTLDSKINEAVNEAFTRLYEKGLIFREAKAVNWCGKLSTTLSDLEVNHETIKPNTKMRVDGKEYSFGVLYYFKYPVKGESSYLEVATTRPETILGDSAVCVNPEDKRYSMLRGKYAINPITGDELPIIFDEYADPTFGTGIVKITPAHDFNDFEIGKKHNLPLNIILDEKNKIKGNGVYEGLPRFEARIKVVEELKRKNLFIKEEGYEQVIPMCSRSNDIIEPMIRKQWWMNCKEMAKRAIDVVEKGELNIVPIEAVKQWKHWLYNIRDWCLSRQLWWGHRIPAYRVFVEGKKVGWVVGRTKEEAIMKAKVISEGKLFQIKQDEDVLDTWFSSGLWPFAILGWPENTADFARYFPTTLLETGSDILFFWVARMVMLSLELLDTIPFKTILLHGIVRDAHGRKMSKSLGNVIDPLFVIKGIELEDLLKTLENGNLEEKEIKIAGEGQRKDYPEGIPRCGADALRFALCSYTTGMRDINLDILRVEGYRRLCNKIWNAFKFINNQTKNNNINSIEELSLDSSLPIQWIIKRRNETIKAYVNAMENYQLMNATQLIHSFFLYDFCDVFIELSKKNSHFYSTLFSVFIDILKLLHPFMPFITEEIYQRLASGKISVGLSGFPGLITGEMDDKYKFVVQLVGFIRSTNKFSECIVKLLLEPEMKFVKNEINGIMALCRSVKEIICVETTEEKYLDTNIPGIKVNISRFE